MKSANATVNELHARYCAMTGFDAEGVASTFGLAPEEVPVMLVTVGRAAAGNWPQKPERTVEMPSPMRERCSPGSLVKSRPTMLPVTTR